MEVEKRSPHLSRRRGDLQRLLLPHFKRVSRKPRPFNSPLSPRGRMRPVEFGGRSTKCRGHGCVGRQTPLCSTCCFKQRTLERRCSHDASRGRHMVLQMACQGGQGCAGMGRGDGTRPHTAPCPCQPEGLGIREKKIAEPQRKMSLGPCLFSG